jgi:hypothetical protein
VSSCNPRSEKPDLGHPNWLLFDFDERAGQARSGTVEEEPHALRFSALHRYQMHLPADVVEVCKVSYGRLVGIRVAFEPHDSAFDALSKAGTDFEAFVDGAVENHGRLLFFSQVFESSADPIEKESSAPDYEAHARR